MKDRYRAERLLVEEKCGSIEAGLRRNREFTFYIGRASGVPKRRRRGMGGYIVSYQGCACP